MNVAETIRDQLFAMDANLMFALGYNSPQVTINDENKEGLRFKVKGIKHKGFVSIVLDEGRDLYDVEIFTLRKNPGVDPYDPTVDQYKKTVKYAAKAQFVEDLPGILEEYCY